MNSRKMAWPSHTMSVSFESDGVRYVDLRTLEE